MTACINPHHDHTTPVDFEGNDLPEPIPMLCNGCRVPAHYDEACEYVHDDPDAVGCFLIPDRPREASACALA